MLRFVKMTGALAAMLCAAPAVHGFSLLGPFDAWQTTTLSYQLPGDIGGPMNLGEEYRWTSPTLFYAFDQNFLDYFGSNGVYAVEQGIKILNDVTNLSSYSSDLTEWPLECLRVHNTAEVLHLFDLKSAALNTTLEELGLTESDRYVWTLRDRRTQPGLSCPFMIYDTIQRNFDPTTWQESAYVNGVLYTYTIVENCPGSQAVAQPEKVDLDAIINSPAISTDAYRYGSFLVGLSRDDVGGLRYLYHTNNVNWEATAHDALLFNTNTTASQLIVTSNLTELAEQALTNDAPTLNGLYPNLLILSSSNYFTTVWVTNVTAVFTNFPTDPVGVGPRLIFITNRTATVQTQFRHMFGNVEVVTYTNGGWKATPATDITAYSNDVQLKIQTTSVTGGSPYGPPNTNNLATNNSSRLFLSRQVAGEYFILPTNLCDAAIVASQLAFTNTTTNVLVAVTNDITQITNITSQTIISYTQMELQTAVTHAFVAFPVECVGTNISLRQGVDGIRFVRASYDSLVGRFFQPFTNVYTVGTLTNGVFVRQTVQRAVVRPDFLYSASDLLEVPLVRDPTAGNFLVGNANPGLPGPGSIDPPARGGGVGDAGITITFNKVGNNRLNYYDPNAVNAGLGQNQSGLVAGTNFIWASFDGSTNAPILYPNGRSLQDLENQYFFQITTGNLPDGNVNVPYTAQLQVTGGQAPYVWSVGSGSAPLPGGLSLATSGTVSGTPQASGIFTFIASVTGSDNRTTSRPVTITILP
jgi:hypothetical protein